MRDPEFQPNRGWFKAVRSNEAIDLMCAHQPSFVLLYVVASRSKRSEGFNKHGLVVGEALVGDFKKYGMSKKQYRIAKKNLEKWGFAAFKATPFGTIATLCNSNIFDINPDSSGTHNGTRGAQPGHTEGTLGAPKKKEEEGKELKKVHRQRTFRGKAYVEPGDEDF